MFWIYNKNIQCFPYEGLFYGLYDNRQRRVSLALALGLSDVIQSYAGGVEIDTLFINEVFGALDAESMEQAIQTLIDLASGNRLVGIISHVSELKERIDRQFIIKKSSSGSVIDVIS